MTNSSVPTTYSITSNDTITIDTSTFANIGANIGNGSSYYYGNNMGTVTLGTGIGLTTGTISTLSSASISAFTFNPSTEEWADTFPDWDRIQKMCKEYPGLAIAFEKFKTTYLLVKNHYDTPEDQRPKP